MIAVVDGDVTTTAATRDSVCVGVGVGVLRNLCRLSLKLHFSSDLFSKSEID